MSEKVKRNITCPKCGNVKETTLLCSVNASSFNEAHKQIFDDTFLNGLAKSVAKPVSFFTLYSITILKIEQ